MAQQGKDEEFGTGPKPNVPIRPNRKEDSSRQKGKREKQDQQKAAQPRNPTSGAYPKQRNSPQTKNFSQNRSQKGNAAIVNSFKDGNAKLLGVVDALKEKLEETKDNKNNGNNTPTPNPIKKPSFADLPASQLTGTKLVDGFKIVNKNPLWLGCDHALIALALVLFLACSILHFSNFSLKVPVSYEKVCQSFDYGWNFTRCYRSESYLAFQHSSMIGEEGVHIFESNIQKYVNETEFGLQLAMDATYQEWDNWWKEGLVRGLKFQSQLDFYWEAIAFENKHYGFTIYVPKPVPRVWMGILTLAKNNLIYYSGIFHYLYAPLAMNSLATHKEWFVPGNCFFWDRLESTMYEECSYSPIHERFYIKWYYCLPITILYPLIQILFIIMKSAQTTEEEIVFKEYVSHNITKDQRPDPIAAADLKYKEPTYARMIHRYYYTWGFKIFDGIFAKKFVVSRRLIRTEEYVVSVELFTHIAIAKYGNNLDSATIVRASIDNAAKVFSTVNLSRFMSLEDEFTKAIVQRTSNLAYHYYLEYILTDNVLFQNAPSRVRAFSMDIGLVRSSSQSLGLSNRMFVLVTLVLLTLIVVHLYRFLPLVSLQVPPYLIQTLKTLRQ